MSTVHIPYAKEPRGFSVQASSGSMPKQSFGISSIMRLGIVYKHTGNVALRGISPAFIQDNPAAR